MHFTDGTKETFDVVIACTGFVLAHPFFDKNFLDYSDGPVPLYLKMLHAEIENLYFIGMFNPWVVLTRAEQQSKLAALALTEEWQRPIQTLCEREVSHPHEANQYKSAYHHGGFPQICKEIKLRLKTHDH